MNVFALLLDNFIVKLVNPHDYVLYQIADFISTIELINIKYKNKVASQSEITFLVNIDISTETITKQLKKRNYNFKYILNCQITRIMWCLEFTYINIWDKHFFALEYIHACTYN